MLSLVVMCLFILFFMYYRRRVANLKAELNHVVKYMTEDPARQNEQCQLSIQSDYSILLSSNGPMNNLKETKPSNVHQMNNFNGDDSNLSDRASYSVFNPDYLNQKNIEADSTNPDFYHSIEDISKDHLYDEIKKGLLNDFLSFNDFEIYFVSLDLEYDHLDHSLNRSNIPYYQRTGSTTSTLRQDDQHSDDDQEEYSNQIDINATALPAHDRSSQSSLSISNNNTNIDNFQVEKPINKIIKSID